MKSYLLLVALFIVGCTASLDVSYTRDMFVATYSHNIAYKTYVVGVEVSTLEIQQAFHNITLSHNEDWSASCLDVVLSDPLPAFLAKFLPSTFLDLRVFYRVEPTGKVCPAIVRLCPDGTAVGPTGVNCDMAPCPGTQVCTDDMATCPDGTTVSRSGDNCEFVCPPESDIIHGQNFTAILAIQRNFIQLYGEEYPYSKYLIDVQVHSLGEMSGMFDIELTADETWDTYCLSVELSDSPTDCTFPDVYSGARVYYFDNGMCMDTIKSACKAQVASGVVILAPVLFLAFVACVGVCCCVRRKRRCACKANQTTGFQRLPVEDPALEPIMMAPMMIPAEFDVEMMNGEQIPYEAMMVPVGYPPMYGHPQQPIWFAPPPFQQQQPQQQ